MVTAGDQNSRNPNLQVAFAHAWYVCSQHSIGRPLRMNGMHRTQSDNSRVRKESGAPNENIVQNHLNIELLNVF